MISFIQLNSLQQYSYLTSNLQKIYQFLTVESKKRKIGELSIDPTAYLTEKTVMQITENSENTEINENTVTRNVENTNPGNVVVNMAMDGKARKDLKMQTKRLKSLDDGISVYCVPVSTVLKWR